MPCKDCGKEEENLDKLENGDDICLHCYDIRMAKKEDLEAFRERWFNNHSPTVWCEIYAHPLHRVNPVALNYEALPRHFKMVLEEYPDHKGKTGDKVHATPENCFKCPRLIRNGGSCDIV